MSDRRDLIGELTYVNRFTLSAALYRHGTNEQMLRTMQRFNSAMSVRYLDDADLRAETSARTSLLATREISDLRAAARFMKELCCQGSTISLMGLDRGWPLKLLWVSSTVKAVFARVTL